MIARLTSLTSRLLAGLVLSLGLVACGGGGGGGGGSGFLPDDNSETWALTLSLLDADGNPTSTATSTTPATLVARVNRNSRNGAPVAGEVVTATTTLGVFSPENGTALTDANGEARMQVLGDGTLGAGTITVEAAGPSGTVTETIGFQTVQADLRLGSFENGTFVPGVIQASSSTIPRNGKAALSMSVVNEAGEPVETDAQILLRSSCERNGLASFSPVIITGGRATADYTASGCEGTDTITASLTGTSSTARVSIVVAAPEVTSVLFESAEPQLLALRGIGSGGDTGLRETSTVTFRVLDPQNLPVRGVRVDFGLTTSVGGLTLQNSTATSDSEGLVSTVVRSGTVATSVRVTATIQVAGPDGQPLELTTISDLLAVTTGLPTQNGISLSAERLSVAGAREFDGVSTLLTVRMTDKFNHAVPDGTTASFRTEYGAIQGSCTTVDGACSVTWTSQSPRFPMFQENRDLIRTTNAAGYSCQRNGVTIHTARFGPCPADLGFVRGMRSTVLVTAIGEESFTDLNGNGRYDEGEPFVNLPEAFVDHNEDGRYNPAQGCANASDQRCAAAGAEETFIDFNSDGLYSLNSSPEQPNGLYNGSLCPVEGNGVWCSRELVNVRDSLVLVLSSQSEFDILLVNNRSPVDPDRSTLQAGLSYQAYVADIFNNPPAGGSTVTISGNNCSILGGDITADVPDTNLPGAFSTPAFTIEENAGGTVTITVDGGGISSSQIYRCRDDTPQECDPDFSPSC